MTKRYSQFHRDAQARFEAQRHPLTMALLKELSGATDLTDVGSQESETGDANSDYAAAECADMNWGGPIREAEDY